MAEETHVFTSEPIGEPPKKRRKIPIRRTSSKSVDNKISREKIDRQLNSIYRDDNGQMPNMRQIKVRHSSSWIKKTFVLLLTLGVLAAAAWAGFFLMPNKQFAENEVSLKIDGSEKVYLGATTTYTISFANLQKIDLKNLLLTVRYPESFVVTASSLPASNQAQTEWRLNNLASSKKGEFQISGFYYGPLNEDQSWRLSLRYQPENFNSELQKSAALITRITNSPYNLTLTGPDKTAIGSETHYVITLEDREGKPGQSFVIQNELPANFQIATSSPTVNKNKGWTYTYQPANTTSTLILPIRTSFTLTGKFTDSNEKTSLIKTSLLLPHSNGSKYIIATAQSTSQLIKNAISINLAINGSTAKASTKPGEPLNVTLAIKNDNPDKATKVSATLNFDAPSLNKQSVLDWNKLEDKADGTVVGKQISDTIRRGQITWNGKDISTMKPAQEVQFNILLPLKDTKTIDWTSVKENIIKVTPEITFTDSAGVVQTIIGKTLEISLNSDFSFETRDELEAIDSRETHNITWIISNSVHTLKNIVLSADLYGDISVLEPITAPAGKVKYDLKTKKLIWEIPEINESMDVLALPFTVTLNTKNPTQNLLVSKVRIQADDVVTGEKLEMMGEETSLKTE
ncbi:MAG: hypothetical protein Q7S24_00050 [bacterium]|nr:hypothetical protein [bacterium]